MSEEIFVHLPKLGESIQSATIVQWFKKEGDFVQMDEPLLEVSTDKVNSEIPSPLAGVLQKILAFPDQELDVGAPLCSLKPSSASDRPFELSPEAPRSETASSSSQTSSDFFSPALLRMARENGVPLEDFSQITGTGDNGRITKKDLDQYIQMRKKSPKPCPLKQQVYGTDSVERIQMSGLRKAIAENMKKSFYEAPHATLINEVDITNILKKIGREKEAFFEEHKIKLTITSFIAKAIAEALAEYPLLNASLEGDTIVVKKFVNLGMAVSVEGGLMVPVIKDCHLLSMVDIAKAVADISYKTREGKLMPQDVKEGTITLTNFGMSGVAIGIPIIRYPEVAIIGVGAIQKKVMVMEDDSMLPRSMIHLSLTFDHRVIDGMYGCGFLSKMQKALEGYG